MCRKMVKAKRTRQNRGVRIHIAALRTIAFHCKFKYDKFGKTMVRMGSFLRNRRTLTEGCGGVGASGDGICKQSEKELKRPEIIDSGQNLYCGTS